MHCGKTRKLLYNFFSSKWFTVKFFSKTLIWRKMCEKTVALKFRNFHTVAMWTVFGCLFLREIEGQNKSIWRNFFSSYLILYLPGSIDGIGVEAGPKIRLWVSKLCFLSITEALPIPIEDEVGCCWKTTVLGLKHVIGIFAHFENIQSSSIIHDHCIPNMRKKSSLAHSSWYTYLWVPVVFSLMKPCTASSKSVTSKVFLTSSAAKSSATAAKEEMFATLQRESRTCAKRSSSSPWKVLKLFSVSFSQLFLASSSEVTEAW